MVHRAQRGWIGDVLVALGGPGGRFEGVTSLGMMSGLMVKKGIGIGKEKGRGKRGWKVRVQMDLD